MKSKSLHRQTLAGWAFLVPNILGFAVFVLLPLAGSLFMAFTNWDLRHQNMFKNQPLQWVGIANFHRLLAERPFWSYLGNTLYLMAGIPFSIAGSLILALLLNRDLHTTASKFKETIVLGAVIAIGGLCLWAGGAHGTALLLGLVWIGVLIAGLAAGSFTYRTLLFIPAFTNGVAVFLLWKKLYNPTDGPINTALAIFLATLQSIVLAVPPGIITVGAVLLLVLAAAAVAVFVLRKMAAAVRVGDLGLLPALLCAAIIVTPISLGIHWLATWAWMLHAAILGLAVLMLLFSARSTQSLPPRDSAAAPLLLAILVALAQVALIAAAAIAQHLPAMAAAGLAPPDWLASYQWAKPALIVVGFWASVGSGNMLLYLAALSNVPQDLYEAADIDGASPLASFWNVTFPQLSPTTFFIVIMSVIGGIQGGFEIARAMTNGGPADSTTTLAFFIYQLAFEDGRLGYASAAAWVLCLAVFAITILNWKVGSRYVND